MHGQPTAWKVSLSIGKMPIILPEVRSLSWKISFKTHKDLTRQMLCLFPFCRSADQGLGGSKSFIYGHIQPVSGGARVEVT